MVSLNMIILYFTGNRGILFLTNLVLSVFFPAFNRGTIFIKIIIIIITMFNGVSLFTGMSLVGNPQTQSYQATKQLGGLGFEVEM